MLSGLVLDRTAGMPKTAETVTHRVEKDWLSYVDRGGMVAGLAYAGVGVAAFAIGLPALAIWGVLGALVAGALVAAVAGWHRHERRWMVLGFVAGVAVAALGAGLCAWLGMDSVAAMLVIGLGGILVTLAHDGNRVLCQRVRKPAVPISILTGFLGSGKTTVLNHVLSHESMAHTAVIINEFGEIGLDHLLVEKVDERMMRLSSGCLCCTVRGDLLTTLHDIFTKVTSGSLPAIERVLVETTGLADPAPILHALMASPAALQHCRLDTITTTVDAVHGLRTLTRHPEAVKQIAVADRLLITKTDLLVAGSTGTPESTLTALHERLRALNPAAPMIHVEHGRVGVADFFGDRSRKLHDASFDVDAWLDEAAYLAARTTGERGVETAGLANSQPTESGHGTTATGHEHGHAHDHTIDAYCITRDEPIQSDAFQSFIELLTEAHGDDLLRVKGILCLRGSIDTPAIIHGVQHVFHPVRWLPAWPSADRRSRLVFITRGVPRARIDRLLSVLDTSALHQWSEEDPAAKAGADKT